MSALILRAIVTLGTTITPANTGPAKSMPSRHSSSASREKRTCANRKSASRFHAGSGPAPALTPARNGRAVSTPCVPGKVRSSRIIDCTVSCPVRAPEVGRSP